MYSPTFDLNIREVNSHDGLWYCVYDGDFYIDGFRLREDASAYLSHIIAYYSDHSYC